MSNSFPLLLFFPPHYLSPFCLQSPLSLSLSLSHTHTHTHTLSLSLSFFLSLSLKFEHSFVFALSFLSFRNLSLSIDRSIDQSNLSISLSNPRLFLPFFPNYLLLLLLFSPFSLRLSYSPSPSHHFPNFDYFFPFLRYYCIFQTPSLKIYKKTTRFPLLSKTVTAAHSFPPLSLSLSLSLSFSLSLSLSIYIYMYIFTNNFSKERWWIRIFFFLSGIASFQTMASVTTFTNYLSCHPLSYTLTNGTKMAVRLSQDKTPGQLNYNRQLYASKSR